ncbi:MAG: T9SS type A sorting domain-containing protein [Flavobacteriales bacterium]|nr:T9SS type A sorting domain-containing protein [Flavobacteriales bacterium]
MNSLLRALLLCFVTGQAAAQTPAFIHPIQTAQYEQFWLNKSPLGGFIAYGSVSDSVDLDPSASDVWIEPLLGYEEAFLAGYDDNGAYLWHKQFPSTKALLITHLSFTEDGQLYLSGNVTGTGDADPSTAIASVSCNCTSGPPGFETDYRTGWYGKYTATGDLLWFQQFGNTLTQRSMVEFHYSPLSHDLYLFGAVISGNTVDFDPGPGTADITPTYSGPPLQYKDENIYARYDSTGTIIWHRNFGGNVAQVNRWDDGANEYFYLTGDAISDPQPYYLEDHDPGPSVLQPFNATQTLNDVYASKFNDAGDLEWCHFFFGGMGTGTDNENEGGTSIVVNAVGDAYVGGVFQSNYSTTPGGSLLSMVPYGGSGSDALLLKLAGSNGAVIWQKHLGSTGDDCYGATCTLDDVGRVYIAATYEGTAELNQNSPSVSVTANGPPFTNDSFVACFDGNGQYQFSGTLGGPEYDGITQLLVGNNSLCVVGNFRNTADLDIGPGVENHTSMAYHDPFFACYGLSGLALGDAEGLLVEDEFGVYPNPANDLIAVRGLAANTPVEVFDALGQRITTVRSNTIAVSTWSEGLYFVKAEGRTQRIVIQH